MLRTFLRVLLCTPMLFGSISSQSESNEPVVELNSGKIKGYVTSSDSGNRFYAFQAIPFAKPPVESLRFKPPEPAEPWEGVFDGTQDGEQCPQYDIQTRDFAGSEDCLKLNVYTPQLENDPESLLPVLVWIHGGGYVLGSGRHSTSGPERFMNHPIVFVSINYRLGILGFLNTEDENAYGNYGMLDQVLALKWVQQNIDKFGGDPKKVTIFGESAGSGSVVHHLLSPLSKGLFHGAIAQSGTVLNPWSTHKNPRRWAQKFAEFAKCPEYNESKGIVDCLSKLPVSQLVNDSAHIKDSMFFPIESGPSIEAKNGPGFLTEDPVAMVMEGRIASKVPVIIGMTEDEGHGLQYEVSKGLKFKGKKYFVHEFPSHLPIISSIQSNMTAAIREIGRVYYDDVDLENEDTFKQVFTRIWGDAMFHAGIAQTVESLSKAGLPTYAYIYSYVGENCLSKIMGVKCGNKSSHADDILIQFKLVYMPKPLNANDTKMANILNKLWTSFANQTDMVLNENEKWPLYDVRNRSYADLSLTPHIENGLLSDKMTLWTETLPNLANNNP